ncbi:MAG: hypothetical protein A4E69_02248 [Syntrophus sp. PtaB.Bin138]|jgi:hypothetical protein|nr:MAG: hypothetical protein A4E69_02248 [Syntrophus sp. PtaB.Bin138]
MSPDDAVGFESDSPILQKINTARELYAVWHADLTQDREIAGLLSSLKEAAGRSFSVMVDLGVVAACMRCEEEEGGSCCGAGIENRYSPVLLLINLLLGKSLPDHRKIPRSCFFLGERGCTLWARHILCINYLCSKIQGMLDHEALAVLQSTTGKEMDILFAVNEAIKKRLRF